MADFDFQQTAQDLQDFVNRTPAEIAELRALYEALTQTGVTPVAADDWPVSDPQEKVIYRVAGTSSYTDYMWNGTEFIPMATYTNTPTDIPAVGSTDVITAGGVANHGSAFDISEYNKNGATLATYADLSAALEAVPSTVQKGGMSIKFVQSNDNKYVQYRLMSDTFNTTVANWQGVDSEPIAGSNNLVESGGVGYNFNRVQAEIGYQIDEFLFSADGEKPYCFVEGKTYIVTNTGSSIFNISIRETKDGENHDTTFVDRGNSVEITASINGYWVRVGTSCSFNITLKGNINSRLNAVEASTNKIELLYLKTGSETPFGIKIVSQQLSAVPFVLNDGETYLVSNYSDHLIGVSTRVNKDSESQNVLYLPANTAKLWSIQGGPYSYLGWGQEATFIIRRMQKPEFITIDTPQNKKVIQTPDVGQILNPTPSTNNYFLSYILPVQKDDVVRVKGQGGSGARVYATTDVNYKVVARSEENAIIDSMLVIKEDGYVVVNYFINNDYLLEKNSSIPTLEYTTQQKIDTINDKIDTINDRNDNAYLAVPATPRRVVNFGNDSLIIPQNTRIIFGHSKSILLSSDVELVYPSGFNSFLVLIDKETGLLSIQGTSAPIGLSKSVLFTFSVSDSTKWCSLPVGYYGFNSNKIPANTEGLLNISIISNNDEIIDFADELDGVTFDTTLMEQVYALFDTLVTENQDYISKVDAAAEVNLSYPSYANGVPSGSDYLPTSQYRTYMYKLIDRNINVHTSNITKGKLFLVAGTHGNEIAAVFDAYLFAKQLADNTENEFYNTIRSNYDVYILPCLNGYGIYHNTRTNANGVNINRNAPLPWWSESGSGTSDYTGPSAGSEFETQLFIKLCELYSFDMVIDHHNYSFDQTQFYAVGYDRSICKPAYNALVNCCKVWRKNLQQYFGIKYKLFVDAGNGSLPGYVQPQSLHIACWAYYYITRCALTLEVSQCVCYLNGTYIGTSASPTSYSNDAFSVAEYTLRESITNYLNAYMQKLLH